MNGKKKMAPIALAGVLAMSCTGCSLTELDADGDGTVTVDEVVDFITSCLTGDEETEPATPAM